MRKVIEPCPFCGGKPKVIKGFPSGRCVKWNHLEGCYLNRSDYGWMSNAEVMAWNRRAIREAKGKP